MAQPAHGPLRTERSVTKLDVCLPLRASRISGRCLPPYKIVTIRNWRCSAPRARDPPFGAVIGRGSPAELAVHNGVFCRREPTGQTGPVGVPGPSADTVIFLDFHGVSVFAVLVAFAVSRCLSAIGVSLPALQESPGQVRDQVGLLVESEVAGVQDVHLGVWHVPAVCLGLLDLERGVVAAPYDLQGWLAFAEPVLPGGIARDVGAVVVEQIGLDVLLARSAEEGELVGPQVQVVVLCVRAGSDVALPRRRA